MLQIRNLSFIRNLFHVKTPVTPVSDHTPPAQRKPLLPIKNIFSKNRVAPMFGRPSYRRREWTDSQCYLPYHPPGSSASSSQTLAVSPAVARKSPLSSVHTISTPATPKLGARSPRRPLRIITSNMPHMKEAPLSPKSAQSHKRQASDGGTLREFWEGSHPLSNQSKANIAASKSSMELASPYAGSLASPCLDEGYATSEVDLTASSACHTAEKTSVKFNGHSYPVTAKGAIQYI